MQVRNTAKKIKVPLDLDFPVKNFRFRKLPRTQSLRTVMFLLMWMSACAPRETHNPLYKPVDYQFETITLDIPTVISDIQPIEPDGLRRLIYKIPVLGKLIAIPFDLTGALIPPIPLMKDYIQLSSEDVSMWADPAFLSLVRSLKITKGWLREKSEEEIRLMGHDPDRERSDLCIKHGIEFIKRMEVNFEYQDRHKPHSSKVMIPLAWTNNSKTYFKKVRKQLLDGREVSTRMFIFHIQDEDLIEYINDVNNFRLRLSLDGKLPCEKTYIEVGIEVRVVLDVKKASI